MRLWFVRTTQGFPASQSWEDSVFATRDWRAARYTRSVWLAVGSPACARESRDSRFSGVQLLFGFRLARTGNCFRGASEGKLQELRFASLTFNPDKAKVFIPARHHRIFLCPPGHEALLAEPVAGCIGQSSGLLLIKGFTLDPGHKSPCTMRK